MKIPEPPDDVPRALKFVWQDGYEAGYKQACKDTRTEQLSLAVDEHQRAVEDAWHGDNRRFDVRN